MTTVVKVCEDEDTVLVSLQKYQGLKEQNDKLFEENKKQVHDLRAANERLEELSTAQNALNQELEAAKVSQQLNEAKTEQIKALE